jgi:hypothetical protein
LSTPPLESAAPEEEVPEGNPVLEANGLGRGGSVDDTWAELERGVEVNAGRVPLENGAAMAEPERARATAAKEVFIVKM